MGCKLVEEQKGNGQQLILILIGKVTGGGASVSSIIFRGGYALLLKKCIGGQGKTSDFILI